MVHPKRLEVLIEYRFDLSKARPHESRILRGALTSAEVTTLRRGDKAGSCLRYLLLAMQASKALAVYNSAGRANAPIQALQLCVLISSSMPNPARSASSSTKAQCESDHLDQTRSRIVGGQALYTAYTGAGLDPVEHTEVK